MQGRECEGDCWEQHNLRWTVIYGWLRMDSTHDNVEVDRSSDDIGRTG